MKKTGFLVAAVTAMTVAAGTAARAEAVVSEETTALVPAISVSEDGELSFAPEFQCIADNESFAEDDDTILLSQNLCCGEGCICG